MSAAQGGDGGSGNGPRPAHASVWGMEALMWQTLRQGIVGYIDYNLREGAPAMRARFAHLRRFVDLSWPEDGGPRAPDFARLEVALAAIGERCDGQAEYITKLEAQLAELQARVPGVRIEDQTASGAAPATDDTTN